MMISGKTTNLGVIGYPIAHSLSPVMQNAGIAEANLDFAYTAMAVAPENLPQAIEGLRALNFKGVNVTIPHKQQVMPLLDEIDEDAKIIGAVNTILNENGRLKGYNTDLKGFIEGIKDTGFELKGKKALLLGAGGAARAIILGLLKEGTSLLTIGVRNREKALPLEKEFSSFGTLEILDWTTEKFTESLKEAQLIINATPLGMHPHIETMPPVEVELIQPEALVCDIIYTPSETLLLKKAREHGCSILNGEAMLVGQGAEAFSLWTGQRLNKETMAKALREALLNK